jgi:hypothetical protein
VETSFAQILSLVAAATALSGMVKVAMRCDLSAFLGTLRITVILNLNVYYMKIAVKIDENFKVTIRQTAQTTSNQQSKATRTR